MPTNRTPLTALLLATITLSANTHAATQATTPTIDTLRNHRRIILIATPQTNDPQAATQTAILSHWKKEAADRDISVITITGTTVTGAADKAEALRRRYRLNPAGFQVLLIGKDGHIAMRSARPVTSDKLRDTIDAMPMRRAGQR